MMRPARRFLALSAKIDATMTVGSRRHHAELLLLAQEAHEVRRDRLGRWPRLPASERDCPTAVVLEQTGK